MRDYESESTRKELLKEKEVSKSGESNAGLKIQLFIR